MKVAIVGSRKLGDICYPLLIENVPVGCSEIISGGAEGIDTLARRYAQETGVKLTELLPDYEKYDRVAPLVRNDQIVSLADYVLILWDGKSRGSLHVIMACIKSNKPFKLLLVKTDGSADVSSASTA